MTQKSIYLFLVITLFLACQSASDKKFFPPEGKVLTFVHELDYTGYYQHELPEPYGVALYSNIYKDVSFRFKDGMKVKNLDALLDSLGNVPLLLMLRLTNRHMRHIIDGNADTEMDALARTLKSHKNNIYLSIGYEVNNPRYMVITSLYLKAHRILVDRFKQNKLKNVAYGWHIIGMKPRKEVPTITLESCYPGDDYVDWLGLSMYNNAPHQYIEDAYFIESIYDEAVVFAAKHDLAVMICESSAYLEKKNFGLSGDSLWVDWYIPFFDFVEQNNIFAISHIFFAFNDSVILTRWREQLKQQNFVLSRSEPITASDAEN